MRLILGKGAGLPLALLLVILVSAAHAQTTYYWHRDSVLSSNTDFSRASNWTAQSNGTGAWPPTAKDDEFTNDALQAPWAGVNKNGTSTGFAISTTTYADELTLQGRAADLWGATNEYTGVWRGDITGDFDVTVKVVSNTGGDGNNSKAGIIVANDSANLAGGGFLILYLAGNGEVKMDLSKTTAGQLDTSISTSGASLGVGPVYLRMVKNGTTFTGLYRKLVTDGWKRVGGRTALNTSSTASHIGLFGCGRRTTGTQTARFDDFQSGEAISATNANFSFNGSGANADANVALSRNQTANGVDFTGFTGNMNFSSYTLTVNGTTNGNATFPAGMTVTAGSGTLTFSASSGTQAWVPQGPGTYPHIVHSGASTLQIQNADPTCLSFTNSAGVLDFAGRNITTNGDFTVTNGTSATFTGLGSRTLTVGGNASFTGQAGNLLNLNPASAWILAATASSTVTATYANIAYGTVNPSSITGVVINCTNGGNNTRWNFPVAIVWDGGGTDGTCGGAAGDGNMWSCAANWNLERVPTTTDSVIFNSTSTKSVKLTENVSVMDITLASNYTGTFDFQSHTLTVSSDADFRSGGTLTAGTGTLALTAAAGLTQVLTPKSGGVTHPAINHTGAGTLQLSTNDLTCRSFSQSAGVLDFNGRNLTTVSSGSFTLTNGTSSSFTGLGGRTLTVAGTASFTGQAGNLVNLNPSMAWTIASTGDLSATYATIGNSTASVKAGATTNCTNAGSNTNWLFVPPSYSAWTYSARISINTTSSGANVSGNVTDFPLPVRLTSTNFIFTQAKGNGEDIRFQDPDGSALSYHIERWDATNKVAEIWVKVPQVDGNSDRDYITMFWGNASASAASSGADVFGTFRGVYHLAESPGASAPQFTDATGRANHGTAQGGAAGDSVSAAVGRGFKLNGSSKYFSTTTSHTDVDVLTIGAWFRTVTASGGKILGWESAQTGIGTSYDRMIWMGNDGKVSLGLYDGANRAITSTAAYNDGAWHHVVGRIHSGGMNLYVDGVQVASSTSFNNPEASTGWWRAGYGNLAGWTPSASGSYFNGSLDEIFFAHSDLGADYAKLAYQTQKPGSAVLTFPNTALSTWSYSTKVYINTTTSGGNVSSNLSNFPLLVRLNAANFNFSQANSNGSDLRFADSAGTLLSYEIERWDATARAAEVWVLIPTVKGNNDAQWFRMYWGKPAASSLSSGSSVFLGSASFAGVWHLAEDGGTSSGGYKDATGAENHGTGLNLTSSSDVAGVIGTASDFAGASNQGISVPAHATLHPTGHVTVEAWINTGTATAWSKYVGRAFTSAASPWNSYALQGNGTGAKPNFSLTLGGTELGLDASTTMTNGTWYHVVGVWDGSAQRIYVNGVQENFTSRSGSVNDYGMPLVIGKYGNDNGSNFTGKVDEARVSTTARSPDWIRLTYESTRGGSTVVRVGARSRDFAKSVRLNFNTTASGANVSGNVTNIPILVRLTSSNFDFTAVRDDGADILFVDKDGTTLYHEVAEWDKGNKVGKAWVKVPQVDGNSAADFITLYYGCSGCTGNPYAAKDSVWSAYTSVFHLNAPETRALDAAGLANHGTYQENLPTSEGITGKSAVFFDNTSVGYVAVPNESNYDFTTTLSVSAWIKVSSFTKDWQALVTKGDDAFRLHRNAANNTLNFACGGTTGGGVNSSASVNDGAWHYVVGTYDGSNIRIYVDGVQSGSVASTGSVTNSAHAVLIGENAQMTGRTFHGNISEVRLSNNSAVLSADFIKLSYQNQKESSAFISDPVTAAAFTGSKAYRFNTTASGANVPGDVYDFPLLLRITDAAIIDAVQMSGGAPQDIRFLDGDGVTWLDYAVERWSQAADSAEVWVKVPKVDGNSAGDGITLYYNDVTNGTVPDGQCPSCVFGTGTGFSAVWRMNDNAASATVDDILGTTNDGTYRSGTANENTNGHTAGGLVGPALDFQGGTGGAGQANNFTTALTLNRQAGSLSKWMRPTSIRQMVGYYEGSDAAQDGFGAGTSNVYEFHTSLNSGGTWSFAYQDGASTGAITSGTSVATANTWYHVAVVWNTKDSAKLYVNGVQEASRFLGGTAWTGNATSQRLFGCVPAGTDARHWYGRVDEIQVSSVVRSADWFKLSYETQRAAPTLFNPSTADFSASRKYAFNTTRTGANVMGDVENFPLLVRITGSTIVDAVQNDYDDIRFLDADGKTWLNYQVERWDKTLDSAEVWVLVPRVDGNSDQDFLTLYYDDVVNGAVANGQCASCVFDVNNSFNGVWHLNGVSSLGDATSRGNTATHSNITSGEGVAAGGVTSTTTAYLEIGNGAVSDLSSQVTLSFWAKGDAATLPTNHNTFNGRDASNNRAMNIHLPNGDGTVYWDAGNSGASYDRISKAADSAGQYEGAWRHWTFTKNTSTGEMKIYWNGSLWHSGTGLTRAMALSGVIRFGSLEAGFNYPGQVDELRISRVERSADWIKLEYETQRRGGNLFWSTRPGPNNRTTLTASPGSGAINLSWTLPVSDSANADSVGIWLRYSGPPDSAGAAGQTRVVRLPKGDSAYAYPATHPGTYYFALAVRNASGQWSPFTRASTDTVLQEGNPYLFDTVYVDSAIGSNSNSCVQARNPATPKLTITGGSGAMACEANSVNDTLVVRVMPGTYASDTDFDPNSKPVVVASFDNNSRAVLHGSATVNDAGANRTATAFLRNDMTFRNLNLMAASDGILGIHIISTEANVRIEGCRIHARDASTRYNTGIQFLGSANNHVHIANNLVHEATAYAVYANADNSFNVVNNVFAGTGAANGRAFHMAATASATDMTITNNICSNWDFGISTASADVGVVSHNLFHRVTSGREVVGETDANKIIKDPLFYTTAVGDPHAFKLLPGSPAIDAGTTAYGSGAQAVAYRTHVDHFGSTRPQGSAPDIGLYEGTGFTPNPAGEFDTLATSVSGNTVIVENSKWKLVWDMARGAGINGFYDKTSNPAANLLAANSLLFDVKIDAYQASSQTGNSLAPAFLERTRTRAVVRQRLAVSGSLDLNVYYTVYASGHVFVQSEIQNISSGTNAVGTVDYTLKVGTAASAAHSGGPGSKSGYGYLLTSARDAFLSVLSDLDGGAASAETWTQSSASGAGGTVVFNTADLADIPRNISRRHHFLLYIGDTNLEAGKAAALNADGYTPTVVSLSAGGLLHERSWQDFLKGHWTLDEGAGTVARDRSLTGNHANLTSPSWISGKAGGALRLTASSVGVVADADDLEAGLGRTYMFWMKPDFAAMGTTAYVLAKGTGTANGWHFRKVSGQNQLTFTMGAGSATTPTLTDGAWTHIAAAVSGAGTVFLYVNGVLAAASTVAATATGNAADLRMGENAGGGSADRFAGDLDDIRLYHAEAGLAEIQAIHRLGFSARFGHYHLRADNNNRVVALLNEAAAATRVQPAFRIDNWYGKKVPKFVYLNGVRLLPNVDFAVDSQAATHGSYLVLQINKVLTGASQTLFVDDDDSSGYLGEAAKMRSLAITATANDKIAIQNFSGTTFGSAASGQWYLELDLNGGTSWGSADNTPKGFGEFNVWKTAAGNPNLAVSGGTNLAATDGTSGTNIMHVKFDNSGAKMFSAGAGYAGSANLSYTLADSSAARLSLVLSDISLQNSDGTATLSKRWTVYPNGRIFGSFTISSPSFSMDEPRIDFQVDPGTVNPTEIWSDAASQADARAGLMGGDPEAHSFVGGVLSIKSAGATTTAAASNVASVNQISDGGTYDRSEIHLQTGLFQSTDGPITVNFAMDFTRDFTEAAAADSLMDDLQTPATITALTGTTVTNDALDFNNDGFAEGDGAYTYTASGAGIAHFRFVNTVSHFSPAFRIKSWSYATLPEYVIVDQQTLVKDYHYNAYVNTATNELILQLNKTFHPGTHVFYISQKTGLAVKLNRFEALGGEGVDTLKWTTESEFENLGFNLYRRVAPTQDLPEGMEDVELTPGAGIANALLQKAKAQAAAKAAAALNAAAGDTLGDTLPELTLSPEELKALGYVKINPKLLSGADGGASSTTRDYLFIDRSAAYGTAYEYLLEAVDFHGAKTQYGPRRARPRNPLETALLPNYPNPFNPVTNLRFTLKEAAKVSLTIYDGRGRVVRTLLKPDKPLQPGKYRLTWDARDDGGFEVPSGQYLYRFSVPKYTKTRKMILVK